MGYEMLSSALLTEGFINQRCMTVTGSPLRDCDLERSLLFREHTPCISGHVLPGGHRSGQ